MEKTLPFTKKQMTSIMKRYPTPFYIYDEKAIRANARRLVREFAWNEGFKEYFAVKALPNPYILKILKEEGFGVDCSSLTELLLAQAVGFKKEEIMFTSNDTPAKEFIKAKKLGAIINLDDISHIEFLEENAGFLELVCFRFNPGKLKKGNEIIGKPEESKYGLKKDQLFKAYELMKQKGIKRFGLHTMVASNELDPEYFVKTADLLFDLVVELSEKLGIRLEFINIGGGIGIAYKPGQNAVDLSKVSKGIKKSYQQKIVRNHLDPIKIFMENGRVITGPYGYLVSSVLHKKNTYKEYIGLDASIADLVRVALVPEAYHEITVLGKERLLGDHLYDVTGSLCTNLDKFAIDRKLPPVDIGDIAVIHNTGAHGHAMSFNYNGKLRCAELLLTKEGKAELIRRAETPDDYFATLDFNRSWRSI